MPVLFICLLLFLGASPSSSSAELAPEVAVRVFSGRQITACTVVSESKLRVGSMATECTGGAFEVPPGEVVKVTADGDKIRVASPEIGSAPAADKWEFSASTPITITLERGPTRSYRGRVVVTAREGCLAFVNRVPLEDYLPGVLPAEIPAEAHPEALKAQAIAARTYALANLGKHRAEGFDLCDTSHCQVYVGAGAENPRCTAAVKDTEGVIVTYDGKPIHAVYHDTCGGRTAGNETAWRGSEPLPYLRPVADGENGVAWCARSPRAVWTRQLSQAKLGSALARLGVNGPVTKIEPAEGDENGRPKQYRVGTANGESVIVAGVLRAALNNALGWDTIPSADFEAAPNGDSMVFAGRGNGHGVGLCQWGANAMAKAGKTAEEILKHYYQGVTVERRMWPRREQN